MIGTLAYVRAERLGSVVAVDTLAGATTLPVDDTMDYDEDGGTVDIDGTAYQYTGLVEDESLTLGEPLAAGVLADTPVWSLDAEGRLELEWFADVDLGGDGDAVPAAIPTSLIGDFPEGDAAAGQGVEVEVDGDGYVVTSRPFQQRRVELAGAFATDTGFDDIEMVPGDEFTPARIKFKSDGEGYNLNDPAGISCFDEPGFVDGTDFYVQLLGARAVGDGVNARPRVHLYTSHSSSGTVSSVDLLSGGSDADFGFVRFFIKGNMKALVSADGLRAVDALTAGGHVVFDDLADGTGSSVDAGARYCRVGDEGRLYASDNPPASLQAIIDDFEARISALEGP